jgi:hypothetical protein
VAGTVNLTMPLGTWLGLLDVPGEVTGFGPLTADDSRHLGTAMAGHTQTQWCVTLTGGDGRPFAHGCAHPGCGPPGPPPSAWASPPRCPAPPQQGPAPPQQGPAPPQQGPAPPQQKPAPARPRQTPVPSAQASAPPQHRPAPLASDPASTSEGKAGIATWLASIHMKWFESAGCMHQWQSTAYRPPAGLQHLIRVRQQACVFPGCRRPASQCDLDHTTPFQRGGLTCECNLAPLCRTHHRTKQAPGWHLTQGQPGIMTWRLPGGRTYQTAGDPYLA